MLIIFSYLWNPSGELRPVLKYFFECLRTNFGFLCCSLHWYYVVCASVCTWTALLRAIFSTQRNHGNNWMVTAKEKDFSIMLKNSWGHSFIRLLTLLQTALDDAKQCSKRFDLKYTLTGLKLRRFFCWRRLHQLLKRLVIKPVTTHHIFNHAFLQTKYFEMVFPSHSMVTKRAL